MNREIKFRAWDKRDIKMCYDSILWHIAGTHVFMLSPHHEQSLYVRLDSDRFEIMQFAGFKDSKGKEIYEGDIMQNASMIGEVVWHDERGAWIFADTKRYNQALCDNMLFGEVIGNIFENPELNQQKP